MSEGRRRIELPERLLERVDERVEHTDFESAEAYLEFAIEQLLRRVEHDDAGEEHVDAGEEEIRDRLDVLGYL